MSSDSRRIPKQSKETQGEHRSAMYIRIYLRPSTAMATILTTLALYVEYVSTSIINWCNIKYTTVGAPPTEEVVQGQLESIESQNTNVTSTAVLKLQKAVEQNTYPAIRLKFQETPNSPLFSLFT